MIAIPAHCIRAESTRRPLMTFQPCSLFCFPPASTTMNAMRVMPSITTANDMRKPTERHMEQKYRSPWQSLLCGKNSQVWVSEEQRR